MKKWYVGWELFHKWNCTPTELLSYLREGLPAYDDLIDKRILDVDTILRASKNLPKRTLATNEIADEEYIKYHADFKDGEDEFSGIMNFALPSSKDEVRNLFNKIEKYRFKRQDVIAFEQSHRICSIQQNKITY